jgi:hypothetical protein
VEACIQNHINYYRTTGRFDPANKAGPAVKPLAVTFIGTVLALLLAA